jgi:hypothetical protein
MEPSTIVPYCLADLKHSKIRLKFRLTLKNRDYIRANGLETIKDQVYQFVTARIAPDFLKNDGKQTPMKNHPVFIAQHATATCCRGCISKWHGIEKGRALNEKEVDFIVALIIGWIEGQLNETPFQASALSEKLSENGAGDAGFFIFLQVNSRKYSLSKSKK